MMKISYGLLGKLIRDDYLYIFQRRLPNIFYGKEGGQTWNVIS